MPATGGRAASRGRLLIDELDVACFDEPTAAWWLEQRRALGEGQDHASHELVRDMRAHLHPIKRIVGALQPHFDVGPPVRGSYLYRWNLNESLRAAEEELIAQGRLRAIGARFVAQRTSATAERIERCGAMP